MKFIIGLLIYVFLPWSLLAQYLEEQNALEAIYESRTRQILGAILSPKDFSVVVAVELDRDELKLKQFRESIDNQYLPGMPMMGEIPSSPQNNNRLHEMKSRVDINIVLLKNLGPDVEKLVKELVTAKLALDISSGDYVKVKRATLLDELPMKDKSAELLPDLSWKMWSLVLILSLLAFSGLLFLAWRLSKKSATQHLINEEKSPELNHDQPKEPSAANLSEESIISAKSNEDSVVELIPIAEIKVQIAKMVEEIPELISASITRHIMNQSPLEVAFFMEHIGWEQGKIWFRSVPALAWSRVGLAFKMQSEDPSSIEFTQAVQKVYKTLLATYIEHEMGQDESNPFGFVFQLTEVELRSLLNKESPRNLAVLFLRSSSDLTSKLLALLTNEKKLQCLSEMGKIEKISQERLTTALDSIKTHVGNLKSTKEFYIDGSAVLAKVLRSMSPEEELSLLDSLNQDNPEEIEKIRTTILLFQDIAMIPQFVLSSYFEGVEVDLMYKALFRMPQSMTNKIVSCLPEKKAMILERDLQEVPMIPSISDIAKVRRQVVIDLSAKLAESGITLTDMMNGNIINMKSA